MLIRTPEQDIERVLFTEKPLPHAWSSSALS